MSLRKYEHIEDSAEKKIQTQRYTNTPIYIKYTSNIIHVYCIIYLSFVSIVCVYIFTKRLA